jgi:hypothetical protein
VQAWIVLANHQPPLVHDLADLAESAEREPQRCQQVVGLETQP